MKLTIRGLITISVWAACAGIGSAQTVVAVDDAFGVPFGTPLEVQSPGVLANDTAGGPAELVTGVGHGVLECNAYPTGPGLCPDGSFSYTPDASFTGLDSFTYRVVVGGVTSQATVALSACTAGATGAVCWQESAFLARLGELGCSVLREGFEDVAVWSATREPLTEPFVDSQGIRWQTNHPDPPASNKLTTGDGAARSGLFGIFDPDHGYAIGSAVECDIDLPAESCRFRDGFTGTRAGGATTLCAVGGHLRGALQPRVAMILDGGPPIGLGPITTPSHQFFGVIDVGGFSSFRVEETDGKLGQARLVFGDDFTFCTLSSDITPPRVRRVDSLADTGDGELSEGEVTSVPITRLLVRFDELLLDLGSTGPGGVADPASYLLVASGGDGFETRGCSGGATGTDQLVPVDSVTWDGGTALTAALIVGGGAPLSAESYQLTVCSDSLADITANPLDGNGDGVGGDDFVRTFTVINGDPPTVAPDGFTVARGATLMTAAPGVLANDSGSDPLVAQLEVAPLHAASFVLHADGSFSYSHDGLSVDGDSFVYRAFDGATFSDVATVTLEVLPAPLTWYAQPTGSDLLDCRSPATACATIAEVLNRALDGDLVVVAAGSYTAPFTVSSDLTLIGSGLGSVLDGSGGDVVVTVAPGALVTLSGFEIRGGGLGGVEVFGDVKVIDSLVRGNGGGVGSFGGLLNHGTLRVDRTTVSGNVGDIGGGIVNFGQLEMVNSTVVDNVGSVASGVENAAGSSLDLRYSTIAGNATHGIRNLGTSTMTGTIVSGHTVANCIGVVTSLGFNLEDGDSCGLDPTAGDLINLDPLLGPLVPQGGPTPVRSLGAGSPAVDAGGGADFPPFDQRGVARPIDGDFDGRALPDLGAVERGSVVVFADGFEDGGFSAWSAVAPGP